MNSRTSQSTYNNEPQEGWSAAELIERNPAIKQRRSPLEGWYRLTAPAEVPPDASFEQRELVRRGRLTSVVLLAVIILGFAPIISSITTRNFYFVPNLLISLVFDVLALWLNRQGRINLAGIVALLVVSGGIVVNVLSVRGGMDPSFLNLFDLLVQGELIAVSLLPAFSVFLVAFADIVFFFLIVTFAPHTRAMTLALQTRGYSILLTPTILQIIVAVVTYLWVTNTTQALKRADRAEVIASLEHTLSEQNEQIVQQKAALDEGIQQLVQTHVQAANGNLSARSALPSERALWPLAGSLNTLLNRFQRALQSETELQQVNHAASLFFEALNQARGGPLNWQRTGTYFDQIAQQYNLYHRNPQHSPSRPPRPRRTTFGHLESNIPEDD